MQIYYGALCTTKGKITHEMDVLLQHKGLEWLFEVKTGCFWSYEICEQPLTKERDLEMHLLDGGGQSQRASYRSWFQIESQSRMRGLSELFQDQIGSMSKMREYHKDQKSISRMRGGCTLWYCSSLSASNLSTFSSVVKSNRVIQIEMKNRLSWETAKLL